MNRAITSFSVRCIGAAVLSALAFGTGVGTALGDPASHATDYFARVATGTRPDDRAGIRGPSIALSTTAPAEATAGVRPDDRGGIRGPSAPSFTGDSPEITAIRPDDRAGIRGIDGLETATARVSVVGGSSFDWLDAAIGAASTLALILVGSSIFLVAGRRGGGSSPAPALHG